MSSTAPRLTAAPESGVDLVKEMLLRAQELVREGWCQGVPARDASGNPVPPTSALATSWSAPGALERVWGQHSNQLGVGLEVFERANLALASAAGDVPQAWNDADGRTLPDVIAVLTEAIEHVGGPPQAVGNPPKVGSAPH